MNIRSSLLLSFRFIKPQSSVPSNAKKSMVGSIVCIALSLIPLIVVSVIVNGMIEGITQRIISLSSYDLQVVVPAKNNTASGNYKKLKDFAEKITTLEGVKSATVERQGVALAASKKGRVGATIRGIEKDIINNNGSFKKYMEVCSGEFNLDSSNSAVIGKKIASMLDLKVGDTLRIIGSSTVNGNIKPKFATFKVKGIVSSGYQELDSLWIFIPLETSLKLFQYSSSRMYIGVETQNPFNSVLYETSSRIESALDYEPIIYNWRELNKQQFENFSSTKLLLLLIMSLIVLVATISVSSSIVMLVMERKKEIAILKSLGANSSSITFTFLCIAFFIGLCGIAAGIPLGIFCSVNINSIIRFMEKTVNGFVMFISMLNGNSEHINSIYIMNPEFYLETIPIVLNFNEIFVIAFLVLFLSVVVSIIPSVRAGKEKPLGILRKV
ncbi:MAG: ABC transporter permease [Treponemataceae bacterium]